MYNSHFVQISKGIISSVNSRIIPIGMDNISMKAVFVWVIFDFQNNLRAQIICD